MKLFLILFLLPLQAISQDLTGIWTGYLDFGETKLPYELVISGKGRELTGYSQLVFTFNGVENVGVKTMEMKLKSGGIAVEDGELIYDNYTTPGRRVKLYANLAWVGKGLSMTLAGTFATRSLDMRARNENSFKGTVFLQRQKPTQQTKLITRLSEMGLTDKLSFLNGVVITSNKSASVDTVKEVKKAEVKAEIAPRKTAVIRRILFSADSITISLYDNGEVDGDTVSVFLNGNVILSKQGLTANAITKTIYSNQLGDSAQLVLYAENLGRIPPNSGLLIIQSGYEHYQVRFSGDLENSSSVILKRRR